MVEHDGQVGELLKKLDNLGIADNTIGSLHNRQRRRIVLGARRRHDAVSQREEQRWEGGYRVAAVVRWPSAVKPHTKINGIFASED
jgi:arylsulfatase A-like enzyme